MRQLAFPITESSQVFEARRQAVSMSRKLGFSEERAGAVALVVTEASTNLLKHARRGTLLVRPLGNESLSGIELLAIDSGGGIPNIVESMRDGHSTAQSAGLGLGSLSRLSSSFDIYTQPGVGTVIRCVLWAGAAAPPDRELQIGVVCVPMDGESIAGDDWALHANKGRHVLLVVDGLGHGPEAAAAAHAAKDSVVRNLGDTPAAIINAIHGALRGSRGAAAAVAEIKPSSEIGTFCGIGNIGCFVRSDGRTRSLVSHNGILGHRVHKTQEFSFPFPRQALMFAYSDGMTSRWDADSYPGLLVRHPALIAAAVYRDHDRRRDDTTLVVLRNVREA